MKRGCRRDPKPNAGEEETDDSERLFIRLLTRLHRAGGSENPAAIFKTPDQRRCFGTKKDRAPGCAAGPVFQSFAMRTNVSSFFFPAFPSMNRFLTTTLSACLLLECSAAFAEGAPLRMGISGFALPEHRTEIVRATEKVIRPMFGEDGLTVRDYTVSELEVFFLIVS